MQTYPTHDGVLIKILKLQTEFFPRLKTWPIRLRSLREKRYIQGEGYWLPNHSDPNHPIIDLYKVNNRMIIPMHMEADMYKLVSQRATFSSIFTLIKSMKSACSACYQWFPIKPLKKIHFSLWWVMWTRIVWHLDLYFRQRWCLQCMVQICLYIKVKFGKVIKLESSRDPAGRPAAVVSPGSTRQVWSSPWLLSLVILSKAFIAVCIWTKRRYKMRHSRHIFHVKFE